MQFFSEYYLLGTAQTLTSESAHPPRAESPRKRRQRAGTSLSAGTPADPGSLAPAPPSCPVCPGESSPCPGPTSPTSTRTCALGLTTHAQGRAS